MVPRKDSIIDLVFFCGKSAAGILLEYVRGNSDEKSGRRNRLASHKTSVTAPPSLMIPRCSHIRDSNERDYLKILICLPFPVEYFSVHEAMNVTVANQFTATFLLTRSENVEDVAPSKQSYNVTLSGNLR